MGDLYGELRPLLFSIAYRMLGSASDAEDIVQEAFLRFHRETAAGTQVESPKSYLSAVTTRLASTTCGPRGCAASPTSGRGSPNRCSPTSSDAERHAETADSLSMGFLVLLESLTPVERAVFLLREVFEYDYDEIASVIGKSEENCRQIAVRARRQVQAEAPRFEASEASGRSSPGASSRRPARATRGPPEHARGRRRRVRRWRWQGVRVPEAGPRPRQGCPAPAGAARPGEASAFRHALAEINGQPGALFLDADDWIAAVSLDIVDGQVQTLHAVATPTSCAPETMPAVPATSSADTATSLDVEIVNSAPTVG